MPSRRVAGFSLAELMVTVAIIGVGVAVAMPLFDGFRRNQDLKEAARAIGNSLTLARQAAIQTGNNHIVYFGTTATTDACGNALVDVQGNPAPVVILDDGKPGTGNCCIDAGETLVGQPAEAGVFWGVTRAGAAHPSDDGGGIYTTGSTFTSPTGVQTRWVLFRPDGIPVGFTNACVRGDIGSGGGAIYVTNASRDYSAVLSPLGAVKVRGFDEVSNLWSN